MIKIQSFLISNFSEPYIIAEIGSNHNGDMNLAKKLIDSAKESGAHCVKFQSWSKESIFSRQVYNENYFVGDDYRNREDYTLEEIVEEFSISEKELIDMRNYCKEIGIHFASTPFSREEADFLVDELNVDFIKVASMDCNNYDFLDYLARKNKPIVFSTGLSKLHEIDKAVMTLENAGNTDIIILHCIANYPPKDEDVNLNNIKMLRDNYPDHLVGYSDHSIGTEIALAAIAHGACIIEKHFTLDKEMFGWDHKVSATQDELTTIVNGGKRISKALGLYRRTLTDSDIIKKKSFRRSVVASKIIPKGKIIDREDLDLKRPGTGFPPETIDLIVGRVSKKEILFDHVLNKEDF